MLTDLSKKTQFDKQYIICFCLIDVFELIIHLDCFGAIKHDDFFELLNKKPGNPSIGTVGVVLGGSSQDL